MRERQKIQKVLWSLMRLRSATQADQPTIIRIVRDAQINPLDLDWRRFVVAEDDGRVVGVGQTKSHSDGSRELASIAVIPERRGQGIGGEIIRHLLAKENGDVYLTCRSQLEAYYTRFGFRRIERDAMTPYFRRITRVAGLLMPHVRIIVMTKP
jgi:N-acetylglutamate synthase-like GNAT family acetyltransferase